MPESDLKKKTVKGVAWSFTSNVTTKGISFLVTLVLARLISPEEYGLLGISGILMAIIASFVDCGFSSALIRKKDADDIDYSTTFILNMSMSVLLYAILYFAAPFLADFFHQPRVTAITRVTSLCLIINAFSIVQSIQLTKKIDFKTKTKISVISAIVSGVTGIALAVLHFGVWALIAQTLTYALVQALLNFVFNRWMPKLRFSWERFKYLFNFGWKLLVSGLIDTTWKQLNQVIIGRCYDAETLGQYSRGHGFAELFSSNLTGIVQSVSFPSLSTIQDDAERMKAAYRKVIRLTMLVSFICMFGLASVADSMVYVLIGEKWMPAAKFLTVICFSMVLYPLHAINLNMLQVKGRSDLFLKLEIIKKIIGVVPLLLGIFVGIWWMLWTRVGTGLICYWLNSKYSGDLIGYSMKDQVKDILPSFLIAAAMAAVVYPMSFIPITYYALLPIQLLTGVAIVFGICILTKNEDFIEIKGIALNALNKLKNR